MNETETTNPKARVARRLLGIVLPLVLLTIGIVPWLLASGSLPDPVATHFTLSGTPDGSMPQVVAFAIVAILMLAGAAMLVHAAWRGSPGTEARSLQAPLGAFIAGLGASIASATAWTQRDVVSWEQARLSWLWTLWIVGLAIAAAAAAAQLTARLPMTTRNSSPASASAPAMQLSPSEKSVWTSTVELRWLLAAAIVTLAGACVMIIVGPPQLTIALFLIGLSMLTFSRIRVRADERGLHIGYGLLNFPRTHIDIDEIEHASAIDIRPMEWGGWGYRGSLKVLKQAAVVVRAGPGLRLKLDRDRTFAVTVNGPETAAALLNALVRRRTTV